MRVWIVGKQGMLTRAFQRIYSGKGIDFIATSHKEVNLLDPSAVRAQFETLEFTHVINCSGFTAVDNAEGEQGAAHALNVEAVELLARLAAEFKKKLVHFSTDYVFDGNGKDPYGESAVTGPLSVYGKTKEEGEKKLFEHCPEALLIRTSWLFGREGNHFAKTMIELMQVRDKLKIVSDQVGRPTFCDDLVEATHDLIDSSGVYHFANSGAVSWFEWAEEIKSQLEAKKMPILCREILPLSTSEYKTAAVRPGYSVLGTEKYEKHISKTPRSWKEGLAKCLATYIGEIDVRKSCC